MRMAVLLVSLMLLPPITALSEEGKPAGKGLKFKFVWDKAASYYDCWAGGEFIDLRKTLQKLGGKVSEFTAQDEYTDEYLNGVDLVIICNRYGMMSGSEQQALVRYVRNGGSLLAICDYKSYMSPVNPILSNFGIMFTANRVGWTYVDSFSHPATTDQYPLEYCEVDDPYLLQLSGKAKAIAGRNGSSAPAGISQCIAALGGNSGKGRVIALADGSTWSSHDA